MDKDTSEQDLRHEALRRRLAGASRKAICHDLARSTSWFDTWWAAYRRNPHLAFGERARAPHTSPHQTPAAMVQTVGSIRHTLEAAATAATKDGLIGPRTLQAQLEQLKIDPPRRATLARIWQGHDVTPVRGAGKETAYSPWLAAWTLNALQATDILTRPVRGGEEIQNFQPIDLDRHAVALTQPADPKSATPTAPLLAPWSKLGLPQLHQLDHAGSFCGGHTHPHVRGRVVRVCWFCGLEPFVTPFDEPKRHPQSEPFHRLWHQACWSRQAFRNGEPVQAARPRFEAGYHGPDQPPAWHGKTPAQRRRGVDVLCVRREMRRLMPAGRLPSPAGRIHFMRKVDPTGHLERLHEPWTVGRKWIGESVRATINTAEPAITFWHKVDPDSAWHLLQKRQFRVKESGQPVLPIFRRKRTRCREYLPG